MSDYSDHLFSYVPEARFDTFSFGHVIPPENLIARALGHGVSGSEFSFTYDRRKSEEMVSPKALPGFLFASDCENRYST